MKITANDLLGFGVIDGIIPEPPGGAHRHPEVVMADTKKAIVELPRELLGQQGPARNPRAAAREIPRDGRRLELTRATLAVRGAQC